MTMETYGRPDLSARYSRLSPAMTTSLCDAASKGELTLLLTTARSSVVPAWNAEVQRLFRNGLIPRIYMCFLHSEQTTPEDTILRLKDTFRVPSASYSVISSAPGRTLICALYSKETAKPLPDSPTPSTPAAA